jgi:hypothetical protein
LNLGTATVSGPEVRTPGRSFIHDAVRCIKEPYRLSGYPLNFFQKKLGLLWKKVVRARQKGAETPLFSADNYPETRPSPRAIMPKKKKRASRTKRPRGRPKKVQRSHGLRVERIVALDEYFRTARLAAASNPELRFLSYNGLRARFGGAKNTIIGDVTYMRTRLNAPLEFIEERGGWGYTKDVPPFPFLVSPGDLLILCASWGALEGHRDTTLRDRVRPAMEKLMKAYQHHLSFSFEAISERIAFRASGYQVDFDPMIFDTVAWAVLKEHELKFVYRKVLEDGTLAEPEQRHIQPRCLVRVDHAWYVTGFSYLRRLSSHSLEMAAENGPRSRAGQKPSFQIHRRTRKHRQRMKRAK